MGATRSRLEVPSTFARRLGSHPDGHWRIGRIFCLLLVSRLLGFLAILELVGATRCTSVNSETQ